MKNKNMYNISINSIDEATTTIAMASMKSKSEDELPNVVKLMEDFKEKISLLQNGNLSKIEETLYAQSIILESFFNKMLQLATAATNINHIQALGHLALKAQNQSRSTLATLVQIKQPAKATFIKQQNNAINQQINNTESQEMEKPTNELLIEEQNHASLDLGRTAEAIEIDSELEAMEQVYRSKNIKGKRKKQNECL